MNNLICWHNNTFKKLEEENNNCIVINFPMAAKGHAVGRLIASCKNVKWYDHYRNGKFPWEHYSADKNFTPFHFNRRFDGAVGNGVCENTVPPVLDMAEKNQYNYDADQIQKWKTKLYPFNFVYPLHSELDCARYFFKPAKHLVIIPSDIDRLVERFVKTTYNYYVNSQNKNFTYKDYYENKSNQTGISAHTLIEQDLLAKITNLKTNTTCSDFVIEDILDLFDRERFISLCDKFDLIFDESCYDQVLSFLCLNGI